MNGNLSRPLAGGALAALLLSLSAAPPLAEVRAVSHPQRGWSVEVEAGPGGRTWAPLVAHEYGPDVLNPGGDLNGDGTPAVGVRPLLDRPEAVWAVSSPQGFDLFLAAHDGEGWEKVARINEDIHSDDTNPVLAYDDVGRSMLLWQKSHGVWAMMIAGLSVDGNLWGERMTEPVGFVPVAMESDGHDFYYATLNRHWGTLRFRLAAFPFPNGGPALPFPDESLNLQLLEEVATGPDMDLPYSASQGPNPGPQDRSPATLAGLTLEMHRHEATVWADWVSAESTVRWIAFRGGAVLDRGEEPFRNGQVDQARQRIRQQVEDL